MKRIFGSAIIILGLLVLTAPLGVEVSLTGDYLTLGQALASLPGGPPCTKNCNSPTPTPTPGAGDGVNLTAPGKCANGQPGVAIALPLLSNGSTCVNNNSASGGAIVAYLRDLLTLLGSAIGLVIVLMLIVAGIQYITSAGDAGRVKSAKDRIVGAITALILFMFTVAILQFLVPGGIL